MIYHVLAISLKGLGVDVGDDVIGNMRPAAMIVGSTASTNVPIKNHLFIVTPRWLLTTVLTLHTVLR